MTAAISLMIIFAISFTLVRISAVILRLTGMSEGQARFQALSALTGTGFTTAEAELIVNYPIRRKVISNLMIIGNLGLVSVVSTLMISFLRTDANLASVLTQLTWILAGVGGLCLLMMNPATDRFVCRIIDALLRRYTFLGKRRYTKLVQVGLDISVAEHKVSNAEHSTIGAFLANRPDMICIAVKFADGTSEKVFDTSHELSVGDSCVIIGTDKDHEMLADEPTL